MKISDFVGKINGGLARTNRFAVQFQSPASVKLTGMIPEQTLMLLCDKVQLPGLNVNTAQIRTYGEVRETPYEFNYEPINISFYVDKEMTVKVYFDTWIKSIQNGSKRNFNYYDDYVCKQMQIHVEDTLDQKWYTVQLHEVYPKAVSNIQLDYASKDIMKIDVTLMYKYWVSSKDVANKGNINNPMNDPKLPFGLPNLSSDVLKIPPLFGGIPGSFN